MQLSLRRLMIHLLAFAFAPGLIAEFTPGEPWLDTAGKPIQAHGGGILLRGDAYYWYGEDRTPRQPGAVSCYSSRNLLDWKHEGVVFSQTNLQGALPGRTFIERPKVIFNEHTGKYVMWMHAEQRGYHFASAGIAVSDKPTGPFQFLKAIRPVQYDFGAKADDADHQKEQGGTFRDMNLFVDDDGKAYAFYASEGNWTMYVVRLNEDYTGPEQPAAEGKNWARILVREMREAPAPFKYQGKYYLITSACTGWNPNAANYAVADNILGPWKSMGNPFVGSGADKTFESQSTYVLPVADKPGHFIYLGDRWKPRQLWDSRYIWLPFQIKPDGSFTIEWRDRWSL